MEDIKNFHLSLLYFAHLLVNADEVVDPIELKSIKEISKHENVNENTFKEFTEAVSYLPENLIYEKAVDAIQVCSHSQKLKTFAWLYKLSEVDGNIHEKEVKFLLYSVKYAGLELEDTIEASKQLPAISA